MKLFHLSDLHIGKQLNGYNLKENQICVLNQIVEYAKAEKPDAILICGDIYDKSAPSGEAVTIFDDFLNQLSGLNPCIPVLIIAGNHDSPERLAYASSFLEQHHIYLSVFPPRQEGEYLKKIILEDEYGPVAFYLLPFLKPGYVRRLLEESAQEEEETPTGTPEGRMTEAGEETDLSAAGAAVGTAKSSKENEYERAVRGVLARETIDPSIRNVILSHQFYGSGGGQPDTCESETAVILAGGLDRVDVSVLDAFDYAALGHLHGAQRVGRDSVRYCGTPYKYSISEEHHKKAVTVITLGRKEGPELGSTCPISLDYLPLSGHQDVKRLQGSLQEVLDMAGGGICHDFVSITIKEETDSYRLRERLEEAYDHILELRMDNARTRKRLGEEEEEIPALQPMEAFHKFYETLRGAPMSVQEERLMERLIQEAKEEEGR